jgi:ATP-dependent protease ClpP protease subunit
MVALFCALMLVGFGWGAYAEQPGSEDVVDDREIDLKERELQLDREKFEYKKSEAKRLEFEKQFSDNIDIRRPVPVIEFKMSTSYGPRSDAVLRKDLSILMEMGITKVILNIFSGGGSGFEGLAVSDVIRNFVEAGMEIEAHAYGIVASAAVPIFASASKRISNNSTLFMVHEAAIWEFAFGYSKTTHSDIRSQKDMMDQMQETYLNLLVQNSTKDFEFWKALETKTTWFSAKTAMEWGLVDEIR